MSVLDTVLERADALEAENATLRAALEEIASGLSIRDPYHIANEALGRAVTS